MANRLYRSIHAGYYTGHVLELRGSRDEARTCTPLLPNVYLHTLFCFIRIKSVGQTGNATKLSFKVTSLVDRDLSTICVMHYVRTIS